MQTTTTCNFCHGTGEVIKHRPNGSDVEGLIFEEQVVSIKIPAGVEQGMQLRISGKGNEAPGNNGIAADLIVQVEEVEHKYLKREGENLHYDLYISFAEAALGIKKEVDTVSGKASIKLESGIQSGKILRLKGKGLPNINRYGYGDLFVHVNVWTPQQLDSKQKAFFKKMLGDENFVPAPSSSEKSFFQKMKEMFN
ncbi:chaperone protein DnaJ [Elysia marginata]|uniref:Chaperone protein DnaJ n=1 Tax=Elysia marginata TaxID=1093978 RepID=A0AAV4GXH8_9GAST|nr:chaperone protein DnaJ [Elysia marginata]